MYFEQLSIRLGEFVVTSFTRVAPRLSKRLETIVLAYSPTVLTIRVLTLILLIMFLVMALMRFVT